MTPRSYEFTCKCCGKTVVEACESEVCASCVMNPAGAVAAPPASSARPVQKKTPKKSGFTVTIRTGPKGGPKQ